jgi:hypothetical protein
VAASSRQFNTAIRSFTYVDSLKGEGDVTSANLLVVLLVGAIVGARVGLVLGDLISNPLHLGIAAGFLATIVAESFATSW